MKKISAKIIADSINPQGKRLTTMLITFPRIILPEFNTHRMLSKNTSSSRAVPFKKKLEEVENNPFIPLAFQKAHKGMQGSDVMDYNEAAEMWLSARDAAVIEAKAMARAGMTKQLINRVVEPYTWTTMLVSGTEWENFFALRHHPDAEIHIQELAHQMLHAMNNNKPEPKKYWEWHIPFGDKINVSEAFKAFDELLSEDHGFSMIPSISSDEEIKAWISCARAARLSYETFDGDIDYKKDLYLAITLRDSGHWSAFEHTAQVRKPETVGNFKGWEQFRKTFANESRTDKRLLKWNV